MTSDNICHIKSQAFFPRGDPIENKAYKGCRPSPPPKTSLQMQPTHLRPDLGLPDPWQLDSEALLAELARIRELALRIPPTRNEQHGPINTVIDAIWYLEEQLRFCLPSPLRSATPILHACRRTTFKTSDQAPRPPTCGAASQCTQTHISFISYTSADCMPRKDCPWFATTSGDCI